MTFDCNFRRRLIPVVYVTCNSTLLLFTAGSHCGALVPEFANGSSSAIEPVAVTGLIQSTLCSEVAARLDKDV